MTTPEPFKSRIGTAGPDHITVAGRDLPSELMGRLTLTEMAFLLLTGQDATPGQRRLLDAVLVGLVDHGLTPSAIATRLTYMGAPEALQGAVAAGLLGAGNVFLGPAGDTAVMLAEAVAGLSDHGDDALRQAATTLVAERRGRSERVPGLGHPLHRVEDPRTPRIYELAAEEGLLGPHLRLLRLVAEAHEQATGKRLPINGAGAAGAALVDVGVPPAVVRAFVLVARTAGLVVHLAEEMAHPLARDICIAADQLVRDA
jgi:citrate synthase